MIGAAGAVGADGAAGAEGFKGQYRTATGKKILRLGFRFHLPVLRFSYRFHLPILGFCYRFRLPVLGFTNGFHRKVFGFIFKIKTEISKKHFLRLSPETPPRLPSLPTQPAGGLKISPPKNIKKIERYVI